MAMLLMTFGLVEIVKLAHPRDWVTFLWPEQHPKIADRSIDALLRQAVYKTHPGIQTETVHIGEVRGIDAVTTYA